MWLCASTRPGTIAAPRASTTVRPSFGPGSSSASVGRIQAIRPSATRTLTCGSSRGERPLAKLASRNKVRRPVGRAVATELDDGDAGTAVELGLDVGAGALETTGAAGLALIDESGAAVGAAV